MATAGGRGVVSGIVDAPCTATVARCTSQTARTHLSEHVSCLLVRDNDLLRVTGVLFLIVLSLLLILRLVMVWVLVV